LASDSPFGPKPHNEPVQNLTVKVLVPRVPNVLESGYKTRVSCEKIMNRAHATREAWHPQTKQDSDAILRELEAILASPHFCNSKRYPTLLRYIVENTLAGKLDLLKERTLGVEVFDRPPTYDTNTDTVVRYTAGEVRKRLLLYYSEHGSHTGIRISLPAGSYVAEFLHGHEGHEVHLETADDPDFGATYAHEPEAEASAAAELHESGTAALVLEKTEAGEVAHGSATASLHAPSGSHKLLWWLVVVAILVAAMGGGFLWKNRTAQPQSAVDTFWSPVMRDQRAVMICTGSSVFAPENYSGVQTAGKDIDYTFVSMQIASSIAQVSSVMEHFGAATQLMSAPTTSLPDLREHSVTLLGGYNNQWTLRFVDPLRFYFVQGQGTAEIIADHAQPGTRWQRDSSLPYSSADDYALVARFRDSTIDGWVVVLAGLGRNGTEAAAEFATSPHYLQLLRDRIGSAFANRNIEAVLKVNVIEGKTGAPTILAVHSW
jgi:hypothetical protein